MCDDDDDLDPNDPNDIRNYPDVTCERCGETFTAEEAIFEYHDFCPNCETHLKGL